MSKCLPEYDWFKVIKDAKDLKYELTLPGVEFRCGETTDDYSSDGGMPTTGWYTWALICVAGTVVWTANAHVDNQETVDGPWIKDIGEYLANVEKELITVREDREKAAKAAAVAAHEAEVRQKNAQYQQLMDDYQRLQIANHATAD
jgi:hypothetical protein